MTFMRKLRRRGFTLMEIVLVIAVGLGLILGGIILYDSANENYQVRMRENDVRLIIGDVERRVKGQKTVANLAIGTFNSETGMWSGQFAANSLLPPDAFRNVVLIPSGNSYAIQLTNLDPRICKKLGSVDFASGSSGGPPFTVVTSFCDSQQFLRIVRQ